MAAYDLEEQEQLSTIKAWWQQHGNLVTSVVVAVAVAVVGFRGWQWYQGSQAAQASAVFSVLQNAVSGKDAKRAREAAGELLDKFPGTAQAGYGALLSAKAQLDSGDLKTAKSQLSWAADSAKQDEVRDLARLRLAALLTDEKAFDEAQKQLQKEPLAAFAVEFADLRGDILALQGKKAEARAAWQGGIDKLGQGDAAKAEGAEAQREAGYRKLLTMKLESLGDGK